MGTQLPSRQSYVVPIPKPRKDTSNPTNYRPIALTSCVCKVMERMVNRKKQNYHFHSEWFPQRSKYHRPACMLGIFCPRCFHSEATRCCYFLWSWKAYDTTWKFGILKDLHDAGLWGQLPLFIAGFLCDRKFQVRIGGSYSKLCEQEMGVPQGGILSVTLFCLKINSIIKAVCPGVDYSLYVDDFLICYCSKHIHIIERHLQRCPISYRNGLTPMGLISLPPRLYASIFVVSVNFTLTHSFSWMAALFQS